ncbi:MAG: leucine-rich repeat protein [Prevotella sp.]|nr:leucine-rich repeat protein [Bacteroidaceae bacterium]MBR4237952.1 leucine-rich repeat protein [Prevotella sp.]
MRKFLLLFFAVVCVQISAWAAITISTASVTMGSASASTTYSGYGIYGAKAGEIAQLLNGTYTGTVEWNGATLDQLKSAVYVKVGSSSTPNILNDADLGALDLLSGAKYLDIDGSVLAEGADITKIEAGSSIEAVTLPNCLTKEQVNTVGAKLATINSNFGSCLSLDTELEPRELTTYTYTVPCSSEVVEYTGTVTDGKGHVVINRPLTLTGSSATYVNTKFRNEVTTVDPSLVQNGKISPNPLKVELTAKNLYTYNGNNYDPSDQSNVAWWLNSEGVVTNSGNPLGLAVGTQLEVGGSTYSYTFFSGGWEPTFTFDGEVQGNATDGYYGMVENNYVANSQGYQFDVTSGYDYTYTDLDCNEQTYHSTAPQETINLSNNYEVDLEATTLTINVPKEGVKCDVIAYVNTPGSLYKATSLDRNDVAKAESLVVSGNINNGDISQGGNSGNSDDPQGNQHDSDAYESNGAISAFNFNNTPAPIKSVDMSDAVIDDYKHLRVLNAYGANLESVVFPKTVTRIPNYCCYSLGNNGCQNLSEVVFPTKATSFTIGDYAFHHTAITSLLIPSAVTNIGDHAFATCDKITDIEMEALKNTCHFDNYVFANCSALKHVTLSEKVENIGDYQFNQCGLLESIRIPSTCKTIGSYAFYECFSIHQMTIPEGVELIKINAFELAGITDLYIMASSIDKVPKIFAMSPTGDGPSTFSYQRTTGNNTAPQEHRSDMGEGSTVHYDEAMSWYQEEQSGPQGLGTGNCLTAIHYPESMKPFYEAIDVRDFYTAEQLATIPLQTMQSGIKTYYTPEEYVAMVPETDGRRDYIQHELDNVKLDGTDPAYNFGDVEYQYLPQTYAVDAFTTGHNNDPVIGPDADGRYYPNQHDFWIRMAAGATSTQAGGVGGEEVASAWGWRQFPLASSVESIGEIPFEKEYDDTWYTMAFPWKMEDNQLFMAFNQKCEIVEFVGAEVLDVDNSSTENVKEYSLVFHFEDVAATYYMDDNNVEYSRERDGDRVDVAGHNLYIYTSKVNGTVVRCPEEVTNGSYNPKNADPAVKEAYGKYLSIQNIMVLPGHPYMIHPSIGAAPGVPAKVYINGVKKIEPGKGLYAEQATFEDVAEANKVVRTVSSRTRTRTYNENGTVTDTYSGPEVWTNPETGAGGKYYFIGNINDAIETEGVSDKGVQHMPLPCYFLGVSSTDNHYPRYYKKTTGGVGKWSQYSAIIVPDEDALANVEGLNGMTVTNTSGTGQAKGANIEIGPWDFNEMSVVDDISPIIDEALEKDKASKIVHMNVVYNINGQVVRADSGSVEGLPKGLYIVNGKKYMVK